MIWGRFSRHNIRVASEKRGRGEEKGKRGRKKREKGRKRGKEVEKRGRWEEKSCAGKGREYFQRCWGRFSTMLCLENLSQHLNRPHISDQRFGLKYCAWSFVAGGTS